MSLLRIERCQKIETRVGELVQVSLNRKRYKVFVEASEHVVLPTIAPKSQASTISGNLYPNGSRGPLE
jgi:hypothetical protein